MRLSRDNDGGIEAECDYLGSIVVQNATDAAVVMSEDDLRWLLYCAGPALLDELRKARGTGTAVPDPAPDEGTDAPDSDQLALDEFAQANAGP